MEQKSKRKFRRRLTVELHQDSSADSWRKMDFEKLVGIEDLSPEGEVKLPR